MSPREVKFRLRNEDNEIVGYERWDSGFDEVTGRAVDFPRWSYSFEGIAWFSMPHRALLHRFKDPFTCYKDLNGKDIYEGDIMVRPGKYPFFLDGKPNYVAVVVWCFAGFHTVLQHVSPEVQGISDGINEPLEEPSLFEVIGNIYENPDLLGDPS